VHSPVAAIGSGLHGCRFPVRITDLNWIAAVPLVSADQCFCPTFHTNSVIPVLEGQMIAGAGDNVKAILERLLLRLTVLYNPHPRSLIVGPKGRPKLLR
jgi:hypothetical protein